MFARVRSSRFARFGAVITLAVGIAGVVPQLRHKAGRVNESTAVLRPIEAATNEITGGTVVSWPGRPFSLDVSVRGGLTDGSIAAIEKTAASAGLKTATVQQATMDLVDPTRSLVIPVSVASIQTADAEVLFGPSVAAALAERKVVLSTRSALLRRAAVGDKIRLIGFLDPFLEATLTVGAIVPDEQAVGAEIVIPASSATFLGLNRPSRVMVWGERIESATTSFEEAYGPKYVRRSWTPPSVDTVLSTSQVKELFGEFRIERRNVEDAGDIVIDPDWLRSNIVKVDLPVIGTLECHRLVVDQLRLVLNELVQAGLESLINVVDTRRSGGCFNSREIRATSGQSGRNLSRHSWGAAFDLNPSSSPYGAVPKVDARVVDVFRRHGFAWGGTWAFPDGMHFEYVGAPRVKGPKLPAGTTTTTSSTTTSTTTTSTSTSTMSTTLFASSTTTTSTTAPTTKPPTIKLATTSTIPIASTNAPPASATVVISTTLAATTLVVPPSTIPPTSPAPVLTSVVPTADSPAP